MNCCCGPCGPKKAPWWKRVAEWFNGSEQANAARAVKYFRAQLCRMDAHSLVRGPAPGVQRCEWCKELVERKENPFVTFQKDWAKAVGLSATEELDISAAFARHEAQAPMLHIRKGRPASIGPAATIGAMRGWKMQKDEADRIMAELEKRAPAGWIPEFSMKPVTKDVDVRAVRMARRILEAQVKQKAKPRRR